jgi:hypothetical protein
MAPAGKVLLFDLGGVLVEATGRRALKTLLPHFSDDQILNSWHRSRAVKLFECGRLSSDLFASEFIKEWELEIGEAAFVELFASWAQGFFEGARAYPDICVRGHIIVSKGEMNDRRHQSCQDTAA